VVPRAGSLEPAASECSLPAARKRGLEPWNPEAENIVEIGCQATPGETIEDLVCAIVRSKMCELAIAP
jgi:hypothetical protein